MYGNQTTAAMQTAAGSHSCNNKIKLFHWFSLNHFHPWWSLYASALLLIGTKHSTYIYLTNTPDGQVIKKVQKQPDSFTKISTSFKTDRASVLTTVTSHTWQINANQSFQWNIRTALNSPGKDTADHSNIQWRALVLRVVISLHCI